MLYIEAIETSQESRGWLKEEAPENICHMSVTEDTSHVETSWLKEVAL